MGSLNRIEIRGFKSIREMTLDLRPLNVLIGANGVGKSNFISAFRFLNELVNENLQLHVARSGGVDAFLYFGRQHTDEMYLNVKLSQDRPGLINAYSCTLVPSTDGPFIFSEETAYFHDQKRYSQPMSISLGLGHQETQINQMAKQDYVVAYTRKAITSWRIYHFHDTSDRARIKGSVEINDNAFLRPDGSNLAAYLYWLRVMHPANYRSVVETIRLVAPFFDDFNLNPDRFDESKIRLEWLEVGSDMYFNATALSDGTLRFMALATLLLQPQAKKPTTILLDEPELGLHPYAITILANLLKSTAEETQIIVSTQSVTLVNQLDFEDIVVVDREEQQSVFRHLTEDDMGNWLDDYSLGDLWEKNVIGGRPA